MKNLIISHSYLDATKNLIISHSYLDATKVYIVYVLFIMSILSCSVNSKVAKPDWVQKRPSKKDYYIGIGIADINKSLEEAKTKSLENAMIEISNQIQLYFEYTTISKLEELQKNDISSIYDYIKTETKLSTKLKIRDVEIDF